MAVKRRTEECYPQDASALFGLFEIYGPVQPVEAQHDRCKGGESYPGVIDGWFCPCPCHNKTTDPELKDAVL
jgi:hypothetical protein